MRRRKASGNLVLGGGVHMDRLLFFWSFLVLVLCSALDGWYLSSST